MGYTTDFSGEFDISPAIKPEHEKYINTFSHTRRMQRDPSKVESLPDPVRAAVGLPVGSQGEFFVGATGHAGQDKDASILDYNRPPEGQPGLWCQWIVEDGVLRWDEGEKFYSYVEWLDYMIEKFFEPWGYTLNGTVEWFGEDHDDRGRIVVTNNVVRTQVAQIVWEDQ